MIMILALLALALAPGIALMLYFYSWDRFEPEPKEKVWRVMRGGAVAALAALVIEVVAQGVLFPNVDMFGGGRPHGFLNLLVYTFVVVALTEEFVKFKTVSLLIYDDPEFDEPIDGIIYTVAASLGFATLENVFYVLSSGVGVGVMRALLAVPAHALFGVVMGSWVGLAKFSRSPALERSRKMMGLLLAVLMHGSYDFLLFSGKVGLILLVFPLVGVFWWWAFRLLHGRLQSSPYRPVKALPVCPECGVKTLGWERFCARCGASLLNE